MLICGGISVFRGDSFVNAFNQGVFVQYNSRSSKPMWISEFGVDAWHTNDVDNPSDGFEDQATQSQWVGDLWDEIAAASSISVGGSVREYMDQWWKPSEFICGNSSDQCNAEQNYFGTGPSDTSRPRDGVLNFFPASPDNFWNAEWWGIVSIAPNAEAFKPDVITPRQVYTTLQNKFTFEETAPFIKTIGDQTVFVGELLEFTVTAIEPDGQAVTLDAELTGGRRSFWYWSSLC